MAWVVIGILLVPAAVWVWGLVDSGRWTETEWTKIGRSKRLSRVGIVVAGAFGAAYYAIRLRPRLVQARARARARAQRRPSR